MEKKAAKGLLAAVVVFSNVIGTTNIASASSDSVEFNELTLTAEETIPVQAENDLTASTGESEEVEQKESSATDAIKENTAVEAESDSTTVGTNETGKNTNTPVLEESIAMEIESAVSKESSATEEINGDVAVHKKVSDNKEETKSDSGSYQAQTESVNDLNGFKTAIANANTTIELAGNIVIDQEIVDIKSNNITIDGKGLYTITVKDSSTKEAALTVKSTGVVLKNLKIESETKKPALTLWNASDSKGNGVSLENIEFIGSKTGVALDISNSIAELTNITCTDSKNTDIQIKRGSKVTLNTLTKHSKGINYDLITVQNTGEAPNEIINLSKFYKTPGKETVNNGVTNTQYQSIIKEVSTLDEFLKYISSDGTIIKFENDITVDDQNTIQSIAGTKNGQINIGKNVTIDGNNHTLDLNKLACLILKGNKITVKDLEVVNSNSYGMNIYNSRDVNLENISVRNSLSHGIFVNGSIVDIKNFTTASNGAEGMKITKATSLSSSSDSKVTVTGDKNMQEESDIDVIVVNLKMPNGTFSENEFILDNCNIRYTAHNNEVIDTTVGLDHTIDYVVEQKTLEVTNRDAVKAATGEYIELVNDGATDNTENLKKLIEYAASHSVELIFPEGTYKISKDIDLSELNLPAKAASNFKLTGAKDGLSIIDGSDNSEMLKLFNVAEDHKMSYVDIEHLVFNNVGIELKGENKKSLTLSNNIFMNGKNSGEMEAYIEVQLHGKKDFPVKNDPNNIKSIVNKIDSNIFLRGADNLGRGIVSTNNENIEITNNFFGNLEGIEDAKKMLPDTVDNKLDLVKNSDLTEGEQGNFYTAINSENDLDTLIQSNYFNLVKSGQKSEHIIYALGYENLQIVGNYFKGQENGKTGGVKISNGKNAHIGSNHFSDVPLLTYIDSSLANEEALLHNTVIYNNLFHQKTNFGKEGTGIVFDQSSDDGEVKDFIIYQNEFKSDERDGINLSERAQKDQFLAYGNTYKNMNIPVNFIGDVALTESALDDIKDKVDIHKGYTTYKDEAIPLTPPEVDYTYLNEIYNEAQKFLDDILNNDLVGDTPGKYPTELVKQLQEMMAEIEKQYNDGTLLQAGVNTFVTDLGELYETVKASKIPGNDGSGSDSEDNAGDGNGSGSGENAGDGNGSGSEDNAGDGNGSGDEDNAGDGNGSGSGDNAGDGNGSGSGGNTGDGNGSGSEDNAGDGNGSGSEDNAGDGNGSGSGGNTGDGNGSGSGDNAGDENGSGSENNSGDGNDSDSGNNSGDGSGSGNENTIGSTINKPTANEQNHIDSLPQTGEVFYRVLTALGVSLIVAAGFLFMRRSKAE